ncbi:MAG: hypothetical protein GXY15_06045 [Candidatus Hydrogenedentes bacterium]|nr:hypothetical protein [Candidatus Hydrogenedentota bacterium]
MTAQTRAGRLRGWAANAAAVLLGFLIVAALLVAAEGALRLKAGLSSGSTHSLFWQEAEGAVSDGGAMGRVLPRNSTVRLHVRWGEKLIYDVTAETDDAGRRVTPCDRQEGGESNIAAFFGCSMTFGQGVRDEETLPARFCAHAPEWRAFNYGVSGYGPQHMWLQICEKNVLGEFSARRGVVVYSFLGHHLERLAGTPPVLATWAYPLPWLEDHDGQIVHRGTFRSRSPLEYFFFQRVHPTHLAQFIERRLPARAPVKGRQDAALNLLVRLIVECSQAAKEQAPGLAFHVVILPTCGGTVREGLLQRLEAAGVRALDYERLFEEAGLPEEELFFNDSPQGTKGHFKAPGYDLIAQHLAGDVVTPPTGG